MKQLLLFGTLCLGFLSIMGSGSDSGDEPPVEKEPTPLAYTATPIYNQAYQENYQPDTIASIIENAHDAYVLVDPFDEEGVVESIPTIQAKNNQVSGYISVGTGEDYREDFSELQPYLTTQEWAEWEGEYFVREVTPEVIAIMKQRIDKMANWGLEWVEFDNMDWALDEEFRSKYGIEATEEEATAYLLELCDYTHSKGMKCMAKNTTEGFENFDGVLYESYSDEKNWWSDQAGMQSFLEADKLVIINHYNESNCNGVLQEYQQEYASEAISFICEDTALKAYQHYN